MNHSDNAIESAKEDTEEIIEGININVGNSLHKGAASIHQGRRKENLNEMAC